MTDEARTTARADEAEDAAAAQQAVDDRVMRAAVGTTQPLPQPKLSKRAREVRPFRAMQIGARANVMIAAGEDVVKLNVGQPDYGAPEPVRLAMRELYDGRPLPYTESRGLPQLRERISRFYAKQHNVNVDPERIIITEGGSSALLLAAALTVDEGDEVIIADPSYPTNRELVRS